MKRLSLLLVAALTTTCGVGPVSTNVPQATEPPPVISTTRPPATEPPVTSTTQPTVTGSTQSNDRPAATDFSLTLGDGSIFRLSEERKPVYMVFWAEW